MDFVAADASIEATNNGASPAAVVYKKGYCHSDTNNPSWHILKTRDEPRWKSGDECWVTDGSKTLWGEKTMLRRSSEHMQVVSRF